MKISTNSQRLHSDNAADAETCYTRVIGEARKGNAMGICPNCGTALDVIESVGEGAPVSEEAAVAIARINADRDIALARMQNAASAAMDSHIEEVVTIEADAETEQTQILADALAEEAAVQPEDIGDAVADAIEDSTPAVTVIGDGTVDTGDEIQPLPDTEESGEDVSDEAPTQPHWLQKKIG